MDRRVRGRAHLATRTPRAAGTAAAAATRSAVAATASTCSVGELRAGEKGLGPDLDAMRRGPLVDGSTAADGGGTETENTETAENEP